MAAATVTSDELASPEEVQQALEDAEKLLQDIKEIGEISGIARLRKKALSEASLLRGSSGPLRKAQLLGSNLASLRAVMDLVRERAGHVTAVEKRFTLPEDQEDEDGDEGVSHVIDVVADGGLTWYKVSARNHYGLHIVWAGAGDFGKKTIVNHAGAILRLARAHPLRFCVPAVHYVFAAGITSCIKRHLESLGVVVHGEEVPCPAAPERCPGLDFLDSNDEQGSSDEEEGGEETNHSHHATSRSDGPRDSVARSQSDQQYTPADLINIDFVKQNRDKALNMDVSTLVVYCSDLVHADPHAVRFDEEILENMAQEERQERVLPLLTRLLRDKVLVVCSTAAESFRSICTVIGGPRERARFEVPDMMSARVDTLRGSSKVKDRSKVIFGTGDALQIPTLTANKAFARAAADQGVTLTVIDHPGRALTEEKTIWLNRAGIPKDVDHLLANSE